jgi:seryl-tRNA synthetase
MEKKMKRKQKRYEGAFEVDMEIVKLRRKAAQLLTEIEDINSKRKEEIKAANQPDKKQHEVQWHMDTANELKRKAKRLGVTLRNIHEVAIPALGQTKAAILTEPLPFLGKDRSSILIK